MHYKLEGVIYIYIDIVPDVPDTSGESKNNRAAFRRPKNHCTYDCPVSIVMDDIAH